MRGSPQYRRTLNTKANKLVESSKQTEVYLRTQLALHIGFTEYKGIYNVRTGFVDKQDGELTAKMRGSPRPDQKNFLVKS